MAFDYASPTGYFPGYVANSGAGISLTAGTDYVVIPFSSLESLNVDAANSGDIRELVYSFLEGVTDHYLEDIPASGRDVNMSITRSSTVPNDLQIRKTYTVTLNLDIPALEVSDS